MRRETVISSVDLAQASATVGSAPRSDRRAGHSRRYSFEWVLFEPDFGGQLHRERMGASDISRRPVPSGPEPHRRLP